MSQSDTTIPRNGTVQFTGTSKVSPGSTVTWEIQGEGNGTIDQTGRYTGSNKDGTFIVTAIIPGLGARPTQKGRANDLNYRCYLMLAGHTYTFLVTAHNGSGASPTVRSNPVTILGAPSGAVPALAGAGTGGASDALAVNRRIGWRPGECTVLSNLGLALAEQGGLDAAAAMFAEVLDLARRDPPLWSPQAVALVNLGEVYLLMGRLDEAGVAISEAERLGRATDRLDTEIYTAVLRSVLNRVSGDPDRGLELAKAALRRIDDADSRLAGLAHGAAGAAYTMLGEYRSAVAHCRLACRSVRQTHSRYFHTEALIELAGALHPVGPPSAAEAARAATRAGAEARDSGYAVLEGQAVSVLADIEAGRRAVGAARAYARQALAIQDRTGWRLGRSTLEQLAGVSQIQSHQRV